MLVMYQFFINNLLVSQSVSQLNMSFSVCQWSRQPGDKNQYAISQSVSQELGCQSIGLSELVNTQCINSLK